LDLVIGIALGTGFLLGTGRDKAMPCLYVAIPHHPSPYITIHHRTLQYTIRCHTPPYVAIYHGTLQYGIIHYRLHYRYHHMSQHNDLHSIHQWSKCFEHDCPWSHIHPINQTKNEYIFDLVPEMICQCFGV
jgi:hypothetical protein